MVFEVQFQNYFLFPTATSLLYFVCKMFGFYFIHPEAFGDLIEISLTS